MTTYINTTYFLLLATKKIGEQLGSNYTEEQLVAAKKNLLELFQNVLRIFPLQELDTLYKLLKDNLPGNETVTNPLQIQNAIIEADHPPAAIPPELSSAYLTLDQASNFLTNYQINLNNVSPQQVPVITTQDLGWTRAERDQKLRRAIHGNTKTFENICHETKEAMRNRLYTLYKYDLPSDVYDKYLPIMQQNNGHTAAFWTTSEREFKSMFTRQTAAAVVPNPQ